MSIEHLFSFRPVRSQIHSDAAYLARPACFAPSRVRGTCAGAADGARRCRCRRPFDERGIAPERRGPQTVAAATLEAGEEAAVSCTLVCKLRHVPVAVPGGKGQRRPSAGLNVSVGAGLSVTSAGPVALSCRGYLPRGCWSGYEIL